MKTLGLENYINNIMDIKDNDNNGKINVNDFLKMTDEQILEANASNKGNKFDVCLQNPPFDKNMHLKFLEKVIEIADKVVSVQPITFVQNVFGDLSGNKLINKVKFTDIEYIGKIRNVFNVEKSVADAGIILCDEKAKIHPEACTKYCTVYDGEFIDSDLLSSIKEKIVDYCLNEDNLENHIKNGKVDENTKYCLIVPHLVGGGGVKIDKIYQNGSKRWGRIFYKGKSEEKTPGEYKHKFANVLNYSIFDYIEFESENEAKNWIETQETDFMKFMTLINYVDSNRKTRFIPYMKSYEKAWTNDELCSYFKITQKEKEQIHQYVKMFHNKYYKTKID